MNTIKFLQKAALVAVFSFVLVSCGTSLQSGIGQVQLGMDKQQVIGKLGTGYEVMNMLQTEQGNVEVLRYTRRVLKDDGETVPANYYYLHFLDGRLVELINEDAMPQVRPPHGRPHR